ncbi:tRNA (adenosine(37)-N6)-threonylcarbamoyltransferase complex dimerization subunit type 1 TsaB [Pedosphaera parvula]|uniref:Peptidase M22 glycoprotease n=1 Tax=Pedosphaera parvula (strain Ellin514) TaxID=320771 RepID=B9XDK7_PEDPL|nr:tRNA (adenosine(37)-N6)-threonylcarbamoyltransferase complex dimerization subunit type 1 TsaB [Pedosphaera parvula]EEF62153.1 peptidase M22 glycoprotease [Pedosphaera parvula Ellin514]
MKTLAIEFSTDQRSVAVLEDENVRGAAMETATRETHAFALIEQALAQAGMQREEIECLAIGIGPGSYTGIRAAIAIAQGWQLARPIQLAGVSSVESLVFEAQQKAIFGKVDIVIDAQRNEFYLANYEVNATGWREIEPLRLVTLDQVNVRLGANEILVGPEVTRWFKDGTVLFPSANNLGRLAAAKKSFLTAENLRPIYLREVSFVKAPPPRVIPVG